MHIDTITNRKQALTELYKKAFPLAARHVSKMGGSFDEAKDVFHDALINWYEKDCAGTLAAKNDVAYIVGTAKYLWLEKYRENSRTMALENTEFADDVYYETSSGRLLNFLERAGKKCMDLLTGFYYDSLAPADIAEKFGYSGVRSATVQKYKCLEKVRESIKQKALTYDDLVD
jgi:DNA-directed RNA polymerase specialized sigma24 family protein